MISIVISGQPCRLLPYEPNADGAVRLEIELPVDERRSLTGRSARRPTALLPRHTIAWSSLLDAADFTTLRNATLASADEPILAPIWSHAWRPASESPTLEGGLVVAWMDGWGSWEVNPATIGDWDNAAPLIYGRLRQPPRLAGESGALVLAQFEIEEDAPAGYAIAPAAGILAADTLSGGWPVFPFLADWSAKPAPGVGVYDVESVATGPGRLKARIYYPQAPERVFSANFTGVGRTEAAQFIAWWIRRAGTAGAHKVPLADFGIPGGGTVLARHTGRSLVLNYRATIAVCELAWRETAPEAAVPEDETAGVTLGQLGAEAWFFKIELDFNGAIQTWNLTNWESGAVANLTEWTYNACDFDGLLQSIDLEDDQSTCTFRYFAGGPWDNWLPGNLAARGFITIYKADASAGGFANFRQVWKGELKRPDVDGPIVKWNATANGLFARMGPRQLMSPTCGTMLFRPRCGLALADWTFNAEIAAAAGVAVTIGTITRANGGGLPAGFGAADWFALGWLGWTVGGRPYRIGILASGILGSGQIALTLERPAGLAVGSVVTAVPGCDRIRASGCTKFANTDNFRGFDQMPSVSPSFVLPQRQVATAKK